MSVDSKRKPGCGAGLHVFEWKRCLVPAIERSLAAGTCVQSCQLTGLMLNVSYKVGVRSAAVAKKAIVDANAAVARIDQTAVGADER
jgi:hypothetical protein